MKPINTVYRLASSPADYKKCKQLSKDKCSFPTIIAYRDNKPVGLVTTYYTKYGPMASNLVVNVEGHKVFTAIRLMEAYETVLRRAGLKSYTFSVDKTNTKWLSSVSKTADKVGETDDEFIFERSL